VTRRGRIARDIGTILKTNFRMSFSSHSRELINNSRGLVAWVAIRNRMLPVHDRAVVGVVRFLIAPVMADLVGHGSVVELDA
jgi:hypothetical protein